MRKLLVLLVAATLVGCSTQDSTTPVPQADTLMMGRIAEIRQPSAEPGITEVDIMAGLPDEMEAVMKRDGRPVPRLEKDLKVRVRVSADTLCVMNSVPADVDSFRVGQQVAALPVAGSCALVGSKLFTEDAAELYHFASYQARFLPRSLAVPSDEAVDRNKPNRVNSSGIERTPLPVKGGRVVYFAAGLVPPVVKGGAPRGAIRPGMATQEGTLAPWVVGGWRPYRVAWTGSAWSAPEFVDLAPLAATASARLTWINNGETSCLVEVSQPGQPAKLMMAQRAIATGSWGALQPVKEAIGKSVGDGQRFGTTSGALVYTVYGDESNLWLALSGKEAGPLDPQINTRGSEWAPRVGPGTTLYFCREERQLTFSKGIVHEVRLAGKQRRPLLEAAPTEDGSLLFCRVPRYLAGELDWDIAVAPKAATGWGKAVPLDDWRP